MDNVKRQSGFTEIDHEVVDRMEALLRRYPAIDATEREALLRFLREGRIIDKGMLSSREGMGDKLRAFETEHAGALGLSPAANAAMFIIGVLLLAAICWFLADIGR